ncbi:hypothetical protein [Streptomyces apocyni]|nr:hypothetical protein [Streptomyces apocyni]
MPESRAWRSSAFLAYALKQRAARRERRAKTLAEALTAVEE